VSSDLERRVRELGDMLRDASEEATRRAGQRALAAARRGQQRPRAHLRWGLGLVVALLVGSGLGFALGTSNTSSGNAASAPVGVGFLPERGWDVLQSGTSATPDLPTVSIAANVELHPDDDADGLPLSTLNSLPRSGIVIIASFTIRGREPSHDTGYPARRLPLRIRDAEAFGIQLRPQQPLGQYELRAAVRHRNVLVEIYFGTPDPAPSVLAGAQRQLARLVVAPGHLDERPAAQLKRVASRAALSPGASRLIDRTMVCRLTFGSDVDVVASPRGAPNISGLAFSPSSGFVLVTSGPRGDLLSDLVVAARPGVRSAHTRFPAAVYTSSRRCSPSRVLVPLTLSGLPGPPTGFRAEGECTVNGRVLVRVRGLLTAPAEWRPVDNAFVGARGRLVEAQIALREHRTRRPLAFVKVGRTGKTQLWTSSRCA
jgi:hypothetical protein